MWPRLAPWRASGRSHYRGDAIAYGYGSFVRQDLFFFKHPGESIGIMDRRFKPVDPPAVRMTLAGPLTIFDSYINPPSW